MDDPRPYRLSAGVVLVNRAGLVFIGRRTRGADAWQMPQGGIDDGETPLEGALRELEEEVGVGPHLVEPVAESTEWLEYDLPRDLPRPPRWADRYRGQRQKWFVLRFLGDDGDIDLGTAHPEFDAWRWAHLAETPPLVAPFKRPVYERLVAEFAPHVAPSPREG